MASKSHKIWVELNARAFQSNIRLFDDYVGEGTALMLVIKANAYGHGLKEIAQMLKKMRDTHMLGVDSFSEAVLLRSCGLKNEIMILGYMPESQFRDAVQVGFHVSLYSKETIRLALRIAQATKMHTSRFHLKVESGTNRLGFPLKELENVSELPPLYGLYTHFAEAENIHSEFYKEQVRICERAAQILQSREIIPHVTHMGATSALVHMPETRSVLARLGLGLYGLWPSEDLKKKYQKALPIHPVLSWKAHLAQVKRIQKGETVGYDRTYRAKHAMDIGIIPVGYYDSYPRALSGKGIVLIGGKRCPIIGRICMNMMMADVSGTHAQANDEAVLIGSQKKAHISVDEVAERAGTINYEIVSRINPLIPKVII
jgi:alanine racemase